MRNDRPAAALRSRLPARPAALVAALGLALAAWSGCAESNSQVGASGTGQGTGTGTGTGTGSGGNGGEGGFGGFGGNGGSGGSGGNVTCAADEKVCSGLCVKKDDPQYGCADDACAPCDVANATPLCQGGLCAVGTCEGTFENCDGDDANGCETDLATDPNQCGACGNTCATPNATPTCDKGVCGVGDCDPGYIDCDGDPSTGCEANSNFDPANCGACNTKCKQGQTCEQGVCGVFCSKGKANCDGNDANGCETTLGDNLNCGFCGDKCDVPHATGECTPSGNKNACAIKICDEGWADCDGLVANGCEVHIAASALDCGSCGNKCPFGPNSTATCTDGVCGLVCDGGYGNCNQDPKDGCELPLLADPTNCGSCANVCAIANGVAGCAAGSCTVGSCNAGFADCNGQVPDGCETNTNASVTACGACGNVCAVANGMPVCATGVCAIGACDAGYADCDQKYGTGCEINTNTNLANCGSCGNACSAANGAPACTGGACTIASCAQGYADCNGLVVDGCEINTNINVGNCGSCGNACSVANGAPACAGGACAIATCDGGFADCDGQYGTGCEINTNTSVGNCGACGNACNVANAQATCNGGMCAVGACNAGFADCNKSPGDGCEINTKTDVDNCNACGNACAVANGTPACSNGACGVASCKPGFGNCNNLYGDGCEVNTNTSVANCGACGNACSIANGTPSCVGGACKVGACNAGFADCNNDPTDGCETNLKTDPLNCNACGNACSAANGTPACAGGVCGIGSCSVGYADCNINPTDGCEINLKTSVNNCNACGNACAVPNATPQCAGGACGVGSCNAGFGDCNGLAVDGCEVDLKTTTAHCGVCGNACALPNATPACAGGGCVVASCNAGFGNCNNNPADGCEVNTNASVTNCGACGNACAVANGSPACNNGACAVNACNAGFSNCNGLVGDGCEINTKNDANNCGACNNKCNLPNATAACSNGGCVIASCNAGFADCNGNPADGCEVNILTNVGNCGVCGKICTAANGTPACVAGACAVGACNAGFGNCNNTPADGCEVNTNASVTNCGACGNACTAANGTPACNNGACAVGGCNVGFSNCNGLVGDGCEINTKNDVNNCGACNNKCNLPNATAACSNGGCVIASCNAGFADCNGNPADGCEVNILTSAGNCGGCGNVCALANSASVCVAGACAVGACNAGFANCNGNPVDGCEINTTNNANNCGGCGNVCAIANGSASCVNSACAVASCSAGYQNCNNVPGDGCEINVAGDVNNCGGCGNKCNLPNAGAACSNGSCAVGSCAGGYANCNAIAGDGCEINVTNDVNNCGSCGNKCSNVCVGQVAATSCNGGACGITACNAGFYNLDGGCANGCECQASVVSASCGTPTSLGTVVVGGAVSASANLVPAGSEAWYTVTFTGNTNGAYHPHVYFSANANSEFLFDVRSDCNNPMACAAEGGVSNGRTDWQTFYSPGQPIGFPNFNAIPPVGNGGTVLIHVYRKPGAPVSCNKFTLTVSN